MGGPFLGIMVELVSIVLCCGEEYIHGCGVDHIDGVVLRSRVHSSIGLVLCCGGHSWYFVMF